MHRTTTFLPSIRWQDHIGIIPFIVHPDKCQITKPRNYLHKVIKAHRVDFISGTHLFVQKAVIETLSALSLTTHLHAILVADLGVEPSSPLSESGVQAVIPIGNDKTLFFDRCSNQLSYFLKINGEEGWTQTNDHLFDQSDIAVSVLNCY